LTLRRDRLGLADGDREQLLAGHVADIDAAAAVLLLGADLHVEGEQLGHLEGLLRLGEFATAEVVFRTTLAVNVEEIFNHRAPVVRTRFSQPSDTAEFTGVVLTSR